MPSDAANRQHQNHEEVIKLRDMAFSLGVSGAEFVALYEEFASKPEELGYAELKRLIQDFAHSRKP